VKIALLIASFIVVVVIAVVAMRRGSGVIQPVDRLRAHLAVRSNVSVFLSSDGSTWERATLKGELLEVRGVELALSEVKRYVISYPSGSVLDAEGVTRLPAGTHFMADGEPATLTLRSGDFVNDPAFVTVEFEPSPTHPNDPNYYRTSITNRTGQTVRVTRFGGFSQEGKAWVLSTANGGFYSPIDFDDWYETSNGVLPSGKRLSDPTNYGGRPTLWAYEVEDASGTRKWVGGAW
jgi:hypothetical protein